jgi:hypothetical protein
MVALLLLARGGGEPQPLQCSDARRKGPVVIAAIILLAIAATVAIWIGAAYATAPGRDARPSVERAPREREGS